MQECFHLVDTEGKVYITAEDMQRLWNEQMRIERLTLRIDERADNWCVTLSFYMMLLYQCLIGSLLTLS